MPRYGDFRFIDIDDIDKNDCDAGDIPPEEGGGKDVEVEAILRGDFTLSDNGGEVVRELDARPRKSLAGKKRGRGVAKKGAKGFYDKSQDRGDRDFKTEFGVAWSWNTIKRNRYRNAAIAARHKGLDFLPMDVYDALWEAAGSVYTEWGEEVEAWKLTAKFYDPRLRCIMIRLATTKVDGKYHIEDPDKGFVRGNVAIVLVKGFFRNHKQQHRTPELYQVLATWESDGRILDRWGREHGVY